MVTMTDGTGHGGYFEASEVWADLSRQIAEVNASIIQATQSQNLASIQATNSAAQAAQAIASETRSDVNRIEGQIELAQSQSESRLGSAIQQTAGDGRVATERNGSDNRSTTERNGSDTRTAIAAIGSTLLSTVEARMTELRAEHAASFATTLLEIERTKFAAIEARLSVERQAAENLGQLQLEAAKNAAAALLENERTKFTLATKMEECCCEMQSAVRDEGQKTRMLIERNEIARLQEELEASRREVAHHRHNESTRLYVQQYANSPITSTSTRTGAATV